MFSKIDNIFSNKLGLEIDNRLDSIQGNTVFTCRIGTLEVTFSYSRVECPSADTYCSQHVFFWKAKHPSTILIKIELSITFLRQLLI